MSEGKKRLLFQFSFLLVACLLLELVLRFMGYKPGDLRPNWLHFQPVDSLYVINDFYTNDKGLLVADSTYWDAYGLCINPDGFRSKPLNQLDSAKKKVLFIGDSFTWGMSAKPFFDSSFCDLLQKNTSYEIINTGIPAADPAQYAAIATNYVPQLKPNMVVVAFFMGNDLMKEDRTVAPHQSFYYWTNAGAVLADMDGRHYNTAQDAYNYLVNERYYLVNPPHWWQRVINKSALLSRLYAATFRVREKIDYERLRKHTDITKKYLRAVAATCAAHHVPLRLLLIPEVKEADIDGNSYRDKYSDLLSDPSLKDYWLMLNNHKALFNDYPDGHLNNEGHYYYYQQLKQVIDSTLQQ